MSCREWRDWLDPYVDGGCTPEEKAGIEYHLKECADCANETIARMQLKGSIRAAGAHYTPPPEFRLRVLKAMQGGETKSRFAVLDPYIEKLRKLPIWQHSRMIAAGAAALLVVVVVLSTALWARHTARQQALAQLLDLHVAALASANPVDVVSTDRHTVKPWFQGKLPFTFNLPDTEGTQFKLAGGKLFYFKNRPGAHLIFDLHKHQLSVFILQDVPGETPSSLGTAKARQKGFNEETWSDSGLRYTVIADTSPGELGTLCDLLRASAHQ